MNDEAVRLNEAETWDGEHLSELAISCLADAQDVIDPVARVHAESCAACVMRIGAMALESHGVGVALRVARDMLPAPKAAHERFPTLLVAAVALVASVCAAPALIDGLPRAVSWLFAAPHLIPVVTTSVVAIGESLSGANGAVVPLVTTITFALVGFAVAHASRASQGVSR